jgi:alanyl-tRNA synthetase
MMKAAEIRESFLKYFESKKHKRLRSSSLVPEKDPTLFFTNAGMVQFKNVFTGQEDTGTKRAATSQKCIRVSGKHNDLENVGVTARHHTFFEMLGNFSFGDYFKKEAIRFAWEYLTEVLKIDKSKLWITVFEEDGEAEALWKELSDVPYERILRMGKATNFWSMGDTGPCGPCSEIHYDHGPEFGKDFEEGDDDFDGNRFMEVWNLVFMQYDRAGDGTMTPLPKPSVDTGMGLERLAAVVQGVHSNYDTDLFTPLLDKITKISKKTYGDDPLDDISMRVIADHIRATAFLIGDGVLPSNEGRGYVLRRIMRRAIRHGRLLGLTQPFFYRIVPVLIEEMGGIFPELPQHQKFIEEVIKSEEIRFLETVEKGIEIIESEIAKVKKQQGKVLSGEVAFKLYDTYGFPVDLSEIIAQEAGLHVDQKGFKKLMEAQKEMARAAWKGSGEEKTQEIHQQLFGKGVTTEFEGYRTLDCRSKVLAILKGGSSVESAQPGEEVEVYTEFSPFYAESGGQVGDQGWMKAPGLKATVRDTKSPLPGLVAHWTKIETGSLQVGDEIQLQVNPETRDPTRLNHTATHLLHAALRKVLGEHVKQAGSLVAPHRLRFDFSHIKPMTPQEIQKVEDLVNEKIRSDLEVEKNIIPYDEAMESGAMALFGEKYGEKVRVLKIADFSTELCGGTHVDRTGEIGAFKIIGESSVAAGVRRIEALTGADTLQYTRQLEEKLQTIAKQLKASPEEVMDRVKRQSEQLKKAQQEITQLKAKLASGGSQGGSDPLEQVQEIEGIKVLALRRDIDDVKSLRDLSDQLIQKLGSGVSILGSASNGKATLIVRVSKDLTKKFHAGNIVKELAAEVGGKGGGRPDMAQAGGPNVGGLDQALKKVSQILKAS